MKSNEDVANEIIKTLRDALGPTVLHLKDDSAAHAGHNHSKRKDGAGGHYSVQIVSELFTGLTRLERQRWVLSLLAELMDRKKIHAIQMDLKAPEEVSLS